MRKLTTANAEHHILLLTYIQMCKDFVKEASTPEKYENYLQVLDIIIEYHNNYGKGIQENNWFDWIMIVPINLSVMTNGYFAGLENKRNKARINSYRNLLTELLDDTIKKIEIMEFTND